jgi:hypothetical protein
MVIDLSVRFLLRTMVPRHFTLSWFREAGEYPLFGGCKNADMQKGETYSHQGVCYYLLEAFSDANKLVSRSTYGIQCRRAPVNKLIKQGRPPNSGDKWYKNLKLDTTVKYHRQSFKKVPHLS